MLKNIEKWTLIVFLLLFAPVLVVAQDTDGDLILDVNDLDDDNDGILDVDECGNNIIMDAGFDATGGLSFGNNIGISIAPWISASLTNIIMVDGVGGANYGIGGPEFDARGGAGNYYDIAGGSGNIYQTFTLATASTLFYSGYFSARDNLTGTGDITIRSGAGTGGAVVSTTGTITTSDNVNWTYTSNTTALLPAGTYSFIVTLSDPINFDEAKLTIINCDTDNDGIQNHLDLDSDNDGITDNVEAQSTAAFMAPIGTDTDGDGLDNQYDSDNGGTPIVINNFEGTGSSDNLDSDTDDDGEPDWIEGFNDDLDHDALADLMLRANNFVTAGGNVLYYVNGDDGDGDGIPDWLEDDDVDGYPNFLDFGHGDYYDTDNDGLIDLFDTDDFGTASILPDSDLDLQPDFRDLNNVITLPIQLVNFEALKVNNRVELTWQTASEINNDYFTVERSNNGFDFEPILKQAGAGNSNSLNSYKRLDEKPESGYNYYRLRQTDFNGKTETFNIRTVLFEQTEFNASFNIYPNPSDGSKLIVDLKGLNSGTYTIEMYNSVSELIIKQVAYHSNEDNVLINMLQNFKLTRGTYFIKVIGKNDVHTLPFVIYN